MDDALIVAVGSSPLVPPIPGLDGDNVVVVNDYYKNVDRVSDDVVVSGGGLAGCERAAPRAAGPAWPRLTYKVPSIVFRTFVSQGPVPVAGASSVS